MFNTVEEVYTFIDSQKDRVYALDNFKHYMEKMGNPQLKIPCIHIGGTNGKGSTTNYIRSVLQEQGYTVGTFTSPFLEKPQDQIRINDQFIDDHFMVTLANRYMDDWMKAEISKFEIEVFIAITYFIENHIDYAIFEVGLGGELDATNIVTPLVAVNTNIGLDHIAFLGNTYEQIARTKAGIVKPGIDYITGEKKEECLSVFEAVCQKNHSQLIRVRPIKAIKQDPFVSFEFAHLPIQLSTLAAYQVKNAALALEVLFYLRAQKGVRISDEVMIRGMKKAAWKGRFEVMREEPLVIIDGAHNNDGIEAFIDSAKHFKDIKVIFTALKDKSTHEMMALLLTLTDDIVVTEFEFYRSQTAKKLAEDFPVQVDEDWQHAIDEGLKHQGTLLITGSLYFITRVRKYLLEKGESTGS